MRPVQVDLTQDINICILGRYGNGPEYETTQKKYPFHLLNPGVHQALLVVFNFDLGGII